MSIKKYKQGRQILDMADFAYAVGGGSNGSMFLYASHLDRPLHISWLISLQYREVQRMVDAGALHVADPRTTRLWCDNCGETTKHTYVPKLDAWVCASGH